jgi:putative membrane protein
MKKLPAFAKLLATPLIAILSAWAVPTAIAANLSHGDTAFLKDAAEGGATEVQLGQLAQKNASSEHVKKFGQRMADDHSKMGDEVKSLAAQKNVHVSGSMDMKEKNTYHMLSGKTGDAFDKAYISAMIKDHENDIAAFQKEANSGSDSDVKQLASKSLPTLQEHLRMAKDVARQIGVAADGNYK